jgi:glycosyltransferase involved in cell wall biosynthesis
MVSEIQTMTTHILEIRPRPLRRKKLRLGMMHYHLKSGGVVSVMRDLAQALFQYGRYDPISIDILASVDSHSESERIFGAPGGDKEVRIIDIPGLAYRDTPYAGLTAFTKASYELALRILKSIDMEKCAPECPYILHAHNISLGKNPVATNAFNWVAAIARNRNLPLWLINHVHDFAENNRPDRMKAFYTCTGKFDDAFARSLMYNDSARIVYVTINSADIENLRMLGIDPGRIFLLPDPIDVEKLEQRPLWEDEEWKKEGLPPADYKEILVRALADFAASTSQKFDPSLPILFFPMKVMRRKNALEALLLIILFERLGRRFQLLISLDANSPPDIEYESRLKEFAGRRSLPVVVGFGHTLISGGAKRLIREGRPDLFSMSDIMALGKAVLTTSIVEGFGFVYHEGWLCGRPVIGRKIPEIARDFESNGMNFDHLYEKLAIPLSDIPHLKEKVREAYERHLESDLFRQLPQLTIPSIQDIMKAKIFQAGGEECIDFADLDADMQLDVIDGILKAPALADRLLDRNPSLKRTIGLLAEHPTELVQKNQDAIRTHYSLQAAARRLESLFEAGDSQYKGARPLEDHAAVLRKYRTPERIRLLLKGESQEAEGEKGG